jgi:hypothetical protein
MDHETAIRMNATERYFLGEMSGDDRDGFEEHFFSCPECSEELRALTIFAANAKAVFRDEATAAPPPHAGMLLSGRALWLSAGLNVALLLGLGYGWVKAGADRRELAEARAPQYVQEVSVFGAQRSGGAAAVREISRSTRRVVFSFYLTEKFKNIGYELKDETGAVRGEQTLPPPPQEVSAESYISLSTADLKPGAYEVTFWGEGASGKVPVGQSRFRITSE